ncbi:hypothetical protein C2S53_002961 [Perilla frutescens var. hirtella]|uniref:Uncharacterized protein n=1 Tax=Perilla frutescens var. hirtella TaxID=608512 RepID=A0AAD4PBU9_PERFH|nr:hypothetical protein C2S53_002961 [Perilla frutescens var. hirtella]
MHNLATNFTKLPKKHSQKTKTKREITQNKISSDKEMSSIIMHTAIPNNKPSKYVDNIISKQNPRLRRSSPTCMRRHRRPSSLQLHASYQLESPPRRTGNYKPTLWDFDRIQSLNSVYTEEKYTTRASELIVQVKKLLEAESDWFGQLELIDQLQKLGLSYHFNEEINQILNSIYLEQKYYGKTEDRDLYSTSLAFRLLRQHGLKVSQDVFDGFKNEKGDFEARLGDNIEGVLQMYEASFLLVEGEMTMEAARVFSTEILQKKLDEGGVDDEQLSALLRRSLELPLHWCVQRPNARWFIQAYSARSDANPALLDLAKLDFNIVQAAHQNELKQISRWWKETRMAEKLPFARDRLVENYIWNIGLLFEPQYGHARIMTTKLFVLITVIDDVFDVYGTLEETQLFNDTILRWDVESIEKLPDYMQICYLALDNFINEMAYDVLKEQGILIIQDLRKSWSDLCSAYAKEAEWYHMGYTPTLDEYMSVSWISISAHTILLWVFVLITNPLEKELLQKWDNYHQIDIIRCSAFVLRLADDLGTSPFELKRGDVPKAVECHMNETGASREEAKQHVWTMLWETWKKMNEESFGNSPFSKDFMRSAADLGRQAQYMYQHGDGHGIRNREMEERILGLIFDPIV